MVNLFGKKLLILGANPETGAIVEKANELGVRTIVTDYNPTAPAKKLATKSYDIDCLDVNSIVEMAKNEAVDGVLVGVADVLVSAYQQICATLNLPCYATKEQVRIFSNKNTFKRICEKYGVLGIPEYDLETVYKHPEVIQYPVLTKPVDNCSGKGVCICHNYDELLSGINVSQSLSRSKSILIERYMTCDDMMIYYTFKEGYYSVSMIGDRFTCKTQKSGSPVCLADKFPSKNTQLYFNTIHQNLCNMFHDLKITNGVLLIQAFVENGVIYVYDPGFRLQGCAPHLIINNVNGFDQIELLIEFALTGSMGTIDLEKIDDCNLNGNIAGSVWFLLKEGTIADIRGVDALANDNRVVHTLQRFNVGDTIFPGMIGTEQQVAFRIHLVCKSLDEYKSAIVELQTKIKVLDTFGNNMIVPGVDVQQMI